MVRLPFSRASGHASRRALLAATSAPLAVLSRAAEIVARLAGVRAPRLRRFVRRTELALACLGDVASGSYRISWRTVLVLAAALLYFLDPFDAVPDALPLSGLIDDATVVALAFLAGESDLRAYCAWRGIDPVSYFD